MSKAAQALIAPSILSADFSRLAQEVAEVEKAGADWLHVDVMDGHFVPNLTIGPVVVKWVRPHTRLVLDCHLMVTHPEHWIEAFARAGANYITIHWEAFEHRGQLEQLSPLLQKIRSLGCGAGLSLNPATPITVLEPWLTEVDLVLVMSVQPGFGGQKFQESSLSKLQWLKSMKQTQKHSYAIEIDGGIGPEQAALAIQNGAEILVAGTAVFGAPDRAQAIALLRGNSQ